MTRARLDPETAERLTDALMAVYNQIGFDLGWEHQAPSKAEFVDVLRDQIHHLDERDLSAADLAVWTTLSMAAKRRLILKVGP